MVKVPIDCYRTREVDKMGGVWDGIFRYHELKFKNEWEFSDKTSERGHLTEK